MRMTRGIVLICTLTLAVSLLGGCKGSSDTKKESSTKIVKVTSVNNKTIKGVVGELEESSNNGAAVIRMKHHRQNLMEIHPRMETRMKHRRQSLMEIHPRMEIHQPCLMKNQVAATIRMNSSQVMPAVIIRKNNRQKMPAMENRKECREVQTLRKAVKI